MKKRLPPWCKLVKHTLIDKDMDVSELATKTGLARPYLSSIINGRIYSQPAVNKVSDCLGISNDYDAIYQPANSIGQSEENKCKKKHTKYVRNKQFGMKLPEETNTVKFRDALIYTATVEADREKLWDNKKVWESLRAKDLQIMNGLDVIEYCLKAGEKDKIIECIDSLSGFEENIEEVAKN